MLNAAWALLIGKFGLGLVTAGALVCAWWLIPPVPWLTDRLRLGLLIIGIAVGVATLSYGKGALDARAAAKAKIEKEIGDAVRKGNTAKERALRDFDAAPDDSLPDDGFRRP